MKVFIIGAGFSKAAGYPLGNELLPVLGEFVNELGFFVHLRNFWSDFVSWRDVQTDPGVLEIINTGNAEFIITHLDLLENAQDFNRIQYYKKAKYLDGSDVREAKSEREKELEDTKAFFCIAKEARDGLRALLDWYFRHQNYEDSKKENQGRYSYILEFCRSKANSGDVFITFNYDALLERALYSLGRWSPRDGYGFEIDFEEIERWKGHKPAVLGRSDVKVLKLHGSVGWHINEEINKIFLNRWKLLKNFIPGIRDAAEPDDIREQDERPIVIEPSFIKSIEQRELLDLWDEARKVLEEAKEVFILGYSMPQADAYAQNLIVHSIRANPNRPKVTVVDPDKNTLDRYEELLGFQIEKQRSKVEEWAVSLVAH